MRMNHEVLRQSQKDEQKFSVRYPGESELLWCRTGTGILDWLHAERILSAKIVLEQKYCYRSTYINTRRVEVQ